jgi:hypothetical protein
MISLPEMLNIFAAFRQYEEHENELLNHRTGWLVTIESVIIGTYGFSYQKYFEVYERIRANEKSGALLAAMQDGIANFQYYLSGLAVIGFLISCFSYVSIRTAIKAQGEIRKTWHKEFYRRATELGLPDISGGGNEFSQRWGGAMAQSLPAFLALLWAFVFVYTLIKVTPGFR